MKETSLDLEDAVCFFPGSTRKSSRGINVLPDEIQALLKACHDIGLEEARSRNERIEPLMYDVQQQMANYGRFPDRKLYIIKKQYIKIEKNYKAGLFCPYPPEARILWGKIETAIDDEINDANWNRLIQSNIDNKKGLLHLSDLEVQELLKEALLRKVEAISENSRRKIIFYDILTNLHAKKLCRRKNVEQLMQDYLRLKKGFLTGLFKTLPPEATYLWAQAEKKDETIEKLSVHEHVKIEPMLQISLADFTGKNEFLGLCRICQAELSDQSKDLFLDVYQNETYGKIIENVLRVKMTNQASFGTLICSSCSAFIEKLVEFVKQCREHSIACKTYDRNSFFDKTETPEHAASVEDVQPKEEHESLTLDESFTGENEYIMNEDDILDEANEVLNANTVQPEYFLNYATDKDFDEESRQNNNYRKYLESRKSSGNASKRQCHLCGKRVKDLVYHLESHSGKEFKCHICDRVCPNRRQIRIHMNLHTKKYVFPCRYCERIFYVWSSRKNHEDTHSKSGFKCEYCGMEYRHKSYLLAHKRAAHLGIRNLKCSQCPFSTSIKNRLLNHVRSIHTSERPYECSVCEHTSNSSSGYYIHFQRHKKSGEVDEYSIKCTYCKELFTKDAALEMHIVKTHPDRAVNI